MKKVKFKDLIGNNDFLKMQELVVLQGGIVTSHGCTVRVGEGTQHSCDGSVGMCVAGLWSETATTVVVSESKLVSQQAIDNIW